jgi:tetraacyldisaccharide 4'-kinase
MTGQELAARLWSGELGLAGDALHLLLAPAEAAYGAVVRARGAAYDRGILAATRAAVPVISVGNLAVGGTGKTPFANWLARRLVAAGRRPAILHGGYAADEPALHRGWSPDIPVVVGRDRIATAASAVAAGADTLVMDDGFQHRRLHRDVDIVMVAAERWQRQPHLLPRGPWRESPRALSRADLVVVSRKTAAPAERDAVLRDLQEHGLHVAAVFLSPAGWRPVGAAARPIVPRPPDGGPSLTPTAPDGEVLLVAAVAEPRLVAANARAAGARVAATVTFGDHHTYTKADVAGILERAEGRPIVTTEKDWTKLEPLLTRESVWLLVQEVRVEAGGDVLDGKIAAALS